MRKLKHGFELSLVLSYRSTGKKTLHINQNSILFKIHFVMTI